MDISVVIIAGLVVTLLAPGTGVVNNAREAVGLERIYFLDTLSDLHVAEVALLNLTKYWQQFGMAVTYASPALVIQTVLKNREFREFGVRQLMSFIRQKSDPIVNAAKSMGQKEVMLDIGPNGDFILGAPVRKAPAYGTTKKSA